MINLELVVACSRYYPYIFMEVLKKTMRNRITVVAAKNRTDHLQNTSIDRYRFAKQLSEVAVGMQGTDG
jgi:hypothetical protein